MRGVRAIARLWDLGLIEGSHAETTAALLLDHEAGLPELLRVLHGTVHGLKSYVYGNAAPGLAMELLEALAPLIDKAEGQ
jgi:hypothetical protein